MITSTHNGNARACVAVHGDSRRSWRSHRNAESCSCIRQDGVDGSPAESSPGSASQRQRFSGRNGGRRQRFRIADIRRRIVVVLSPPDEAAVSSSAAAGTNRPGRLPSSHARSVAASPPPSATPVADRRSWRRIHVDQPVRPGIYICSDKTGFWAKVRSVKLISVRKVKSLSLKWNDCLSTSVFKSFTAHTFQRKTD